MSAAGEAAAWLEFPSDSPGFAAALRAAASAHAGRDILVTLPGARLPFAIEERLRKAAHAGAAIAAAVPMCDLSPLQALVDADHGPVSADDAERIDHSAYTMGLRAYYEVPAIHPACAYLRRDALDAVVDRLPASGKPQEVLDAFARACAALGRPCVLCDYAYVGFEGPVALPAKALPTLEERAYVRHHPLGALRRALNTGLREGLPPVSTPGLDARPVQLHIMHFWGGGLDRWVRDFGRADASRVNLILATYRIGEEGGQRVVLYSDPGAKLPVRTWDIARPIRSTAVASLEYRQILEQVIDEYGVEAIVVSSLIGHSLDALTMPVKTIVVCHDFYPVCQAINPQFRGTTCTHCTLDDLRECARLNPLNRIFTDTSSEDWHAMRSRYVDILLERRIEMVVPSASVAATLKRIEPRLAPVRTHVIGHGIDFDVAKLPYPARAAGEKLRLVVLGRLSVHKGMEMLREAAAALAPYATVTIVGGGGNGAELGKACGWDVIEGYEVEELPAILARLAPHAAILASVVPETFSYTLSELWALGIPPIATALGSFAERIAEGDSGFLFQPKADDLVRVVRELHARPAWLEAAARSLRTRERGATVAQMVAAYHALVPMAARPVARFKVGVGRETALTEPYRHLNDAYAHLSDAYASMEQAYESTREAQARTRAAFDEAHAERDRVMGISNEALAELEKLRLGTNWWRGRKAAALLRSWREKMYPDNDKK